MADIAKCVIYCRVLLAGLLITVGHRTISGQNCYLSVHMRISRKKLAATLLFFVGARDV